MIASCYDCHRYRRFALQTILAASLLLGAPAGAETPPPLSGTLDASLLYDVSSDSLSFDGEATVELAFATWKASAEADFDEGVWDEQTFGVCWSQDVVEIESTVRFEPDKNQFKDWKTDFVWTFGAVDLEVEHKLTRTRNWLTVDLDWASDALEIDTRVRLRSADCEPPAFYDAEAKAAFSVCGTDTSIEVEIDGDGFDALTLGITDLAITRLPWLSIDIEAVCTLTTTTIEIEPSIELGAATCLTFEAENVTGGGHIGPPRLTEVTLECDFLAAAIEATVYLDPDDWIDDRYAATLTLETEGSLAPERAIQTETTLFWNGLPTPNVTRVVPRVGFELTGHTFIWLGLDIDAKTTGMDSVSAGVKLTW